MEHQSHVVCRMGVHVPTRLAALAKFSRVVLIPHQRQLVLHLGQHSMPLSALISHLVLPLRKATAQQKVTSTKQSNQMGDLAQRARGIPRMLAIAYFFVQWLVA